MENKDNNSNESGEVSVWQQLLNDYSPPGQTSKRDTNLIILGHSGCGARSIIARLLGQDPADAQKGFALEYEYYTVRNEQEDDTSGIVHIWHLESPAYSDLLTVALPLENLNNSVVMIVLDLLAPHTIQSRLDEWQNKLSDHLKKLCGNDHVKRRSFEQNVLKYLAWFQHEQKKKEKSASQNTEAPVEIKKPSIQRAGITVIEPKEIEVVEEEPEYKDAIIGPGVLTTNYGIPIIVVGSKGDQLENVITKDVTNILNSSNNSNAKAPKQLMNYIQAHLRKWCLNNGAALFFVSAQLNINCPLLMNYVLHRLYQIPFKQDKTLTKPDAIVIPFGSDSMADITKLQIELISSNGLDATYDVIVNDPNKNKTSTIGVQITDHQTFLIKQQELIQRKERDGDLLKPIGGKFGSSANLRPKPKDGALPSSGKKVEQDAEKFFASMLKNYKK